jgi:hypothetical protein
VAATQGLDRRDSGLGVVLTTVASKLVGSTKSCSRRDTTMAEGQRMTVADVVARVGDGRVEDFVREGAEAKPTKDRLDAVN